MSYDIYLRKPRCEACGHEDYGPDCPDPTYNLTPIFHFALTGEQMPNQDVSEGSVVLLGAKTDGPRGLRVLSGMKARESVVMLAQALDRVRKPVNEPFLRAMEPANKWGTLDGAIEVLGMLMELAIDEGNAERVWDIH